MEFAPSAKELSHFPFLKKAQEHIKVRFSLLETLLDEPKSEALVNSAINRIKEAITPKKNFDPKVADIPDEEIASYALARIIVSCVNDRQLIDRLTRYEAERAYHFLVNEEEWNQNYFLEDGRYSRLWIAIARELGIRITEDRMQVADYVELVAPMHDDRYRLINRQVGRGFVSIKPDERYELLRERIRVLLRRDLPHKVPQSICETLAPKAAQIKKVYQEQMLRQFGTVEEQAFPPCIQVLISALSDGKNLTHAGRFSLTAFLHNIGMTPVEIAQLFARSPDFDIEKTMYQVEHITGRGGTSTDYTTPSCAAMLTTGVCVRKAPLCEKVSHPLSYYKVKKSDRKTKTVPAGKEPEQTEADKKVQKEPEKT